MNDFDTILNLPPIALVALGILIVVELTLLVIGVVAWSGTPDDHMPPPNRWLWLAIVVLLQIFGPIAFLISRRSQAKYAMTDDATPAPPAPRPSSDATVDLLYGPREDERR